MAGWPERADFRGSLEAGADPNERDAEGRTALHALAEEPAMLPVLSVLEAHVAALSLVCRQQRYGASIMQTPLEDAAATGNTTFLKQLLQKGADVNARSDDNTALCYAAGRQSSDLVALLLNAGADVNALNNQGQTPLDWAVTVRAIDGTDASVNLEMLISHGARHGTEGRVAPLEGCMF